ncbi:MAG: hypothetical protein DRP27_06765 [Thermotogae bacterium]|nr:cellulase family glycosylhydrolase [Thermotogota bacterium]RKX44325.1 MAG: hypothetical protein DRP27_06765 [Thermotogota bacterium]
MKGFSLGVNYWSRSGAIFMWEDEYWNPNVVEQEVKAMKELGIDICRSFIFLPTFLPAPYTLSQKHVDRFKTFLDMCSYHGLKVAPTFIVGHMSGENWDPPFRENRDLYEDPFMLNQQEFVITQITPQIKDFSSVWGYILTNEMPLYGGIADPEKVYSWAKRLVSALKLVDPYRPVGIGDGNWNVLGGNNGFEIQRISQLVDYLGPHMYLTETDDYRHSMLTEFIITALRRYGKPVILEEFGAPSSHASDENIALYYREVFHNVFFAGGVGAWGWCLNDFDTYDQRPYLHHPFELRFGIFRSDGSPKPVAAEFERFQAFLKDKMDVSPVKTKAAILIPSWYNLSYPFGESDPEEIRRHVVQSMVLAAKAGFAVDVLFEQDELNLSEYRLILLPAIQQYLGPTWEHLLDYVREGGNVYLSYYAGKKQFHSGLWIHNFEELTGCRHGMRYGLPDPLPNPLKLSFQSTKWELRYPVMSSPFETSHLPIEPTEPSIRVFKLDGEILKFTVRPKDKGNFIFLNFPLEHLLAVTPYVNYADRSDVIYGFLADLAGIDRYRTDNPMVRVRQVKVSSKERLFLQNVSWQVEKVSNVLLPRKNVRFDAELNPKEVKELPL